MRELLTTTELCQRLKTSRRNIELLRHKGLPYLAFPQGSPRFDYEVVLAWLAENARKKNERKLQQEDVVFD